MKPPAFDIDLDKHYKATMVMVCEQCGHEVRQHLQSLHPDAELSCECGSHISVSPLILQQAAQRVQQIKQSYHLS
ncbi:hypothetical protein HZU77_002570 [Neisseriaceae bacterium TC5R-5]|nr:hypothetical protein [Neisseriaceae bacterium TC5R-5]